MKQFSWRKFSSLFFTCVLFALSCVFIVFEVWQPYAESQKLADQVVFQHKYQTDTNNLQSTLDLYLQTLFSARAFLMAGNDVSRASWATYFNNIGIGRQLPGLGFLAYIEQVPDNRISAFENELKNDKLLQEKGLTDIVIHPKVPSEFHQVTKFIEPENSTTLKSLLGFDFSSEATRRAAFEKARDLNVAVSTAPIHFYSNQKSGFVMMLPLYDRNKSIVTPEQRRDAYYGLVVISVRIKDIFDNSFSRLAAENTFVQVFDGVNTDEDHLIYQNMETSKVPTGHLQTVLEPVTLADRTLTIKYTFLEPTKSFALISSVWARVGILIATNLITTWYVWTRMRTSKH